MHKDVPFGWLAALMSALDRRAARRAVRRETESLQRHRARREAERSPRPYSQSRFIRGW